jgi:hypothetical protein
MSTSSRALPTCPPKYSAAPRSIDELLWAVHALGQRTGRLPRGLSRARIGPGATITCHRSSITPTFVTDGTPIDGLKLELRRGEYRFAARVLGRALWLRSAQSSG